MSELYYDRGFLNVRVDAPKKVRATDGVTAITFTIVEGPAFRIGTLKTRGVDAATEKEVLAKVTTKPAQVFARGKLEKDVEAIRAMLRERGKRNTRVESETDLDRKKAVVDVTLAISGA